MYRTRFHNNLLALDSLKVKQAKQSVIIGVALLVSFLINLPRALTLFNVVDKLGETLNQSTVKEVVLRFIVLSIFSWLALQFYTNWKNFYTHLSKIKIIVLEIVVGVLLYFTTIEIFVLLYEALIQDTLTNQELIILYVVYLVVLILMVFASGILRYQIIHQQDVVEKEALKKQSLQNELEALKNQINPHFLFNSLNSLNALVRNNKQATTFVNKLSFMYRYILQSSSNDLVTLKEELKFLESYIFLIKTRYRDRFNIDIAIDQKLLPEEVPSMSLQLLVENAIKHNEISETHPLSVKVYSQDNSIVVENKIRPRTTFVDSTGNGLANLNKRYLMLKNTQIVISNANTLFKVKLPL